MDKEKDSSIITAEGIKVVTYLQEQLEHNKHDGPIYIAPKDLKALEDLLIDHQAQAVTIKSLKDRLELYKTPHERLIELGWVALNETCGTLTYLLNVDGSLHPQRIELSLEGKSFYTTLRFIDLELAEILADYLKELRDE